jgi:hypothetical protein
MIEVSQLEIKKFMEDPTNAELVRSIDLWFTQKTSEGNLLDILCFVQAISILCGIAGREMKELQAILNGGKTFGNA